MGVWFLSLMMNQALTTPLILPIALHTEITRVTPVPTDHKTEQQKILRTAGVRSWSKLSEGVSCSVTQKAHEISILPTRREGRAFMHVPDLTIRVATNSPPEQVGRALREGFQ